MINQFSMEEEIGVPLTLPKSLATFLHANYARFKLLGIGEEQQLFCSKALIRALSYKNTGTIHQ